MLVLGYASVLLAQQSLQPPQVNNPAAGGPTGSAGGTGAAGATGSPGAAGTFIIPIAPTATVLAQATQVAALNSFMNFDYTLGTSGGNIFLASPTPGITYKLRLIQGTTAAPMPTISPAPHWKSSAVPTLTTTASGWDIVICYYDGTHLNCDLEGPFQ